MKLQRNKRGLVATLALAAIMGTSAYAFTATNTFTGGAGAAGDGSSGPGSISGYDVTNIHYDSVGNTNITDVTFDISPAVPTGTVRAGLNTSTLQSCTDTSAGAGTTFHCDVSAEVPAVSILASDSLRVVAFG
jgi:hypothetical protein